MTKNLNSDEHVKNSCLKKTLWTIFDCSKNRFDRLKITFNRSSSDRASIEPGRFKPNFNRNFDWLEIGSIDWKYGKIKFLKNRAILCRNSSKHSILWIECMSIRWNVFQKQLYWAQISQKQDFQSIFP